MTPEKKRRPSSPKTSSLTRRQQFVVASQKRRDALRAKGYKGITVYLSPKAIAQLEVLQKRYGSTRAEVLEQVLESVATGQPLPPKPELGA